MKRTKKRCLNCDKEISLSNYNTHSLSCINKKDPLFKIPREWKISDTKYKCGICNKFFSLKGMVSHYYRIHTQQGKDFVQTQKPWLNVVAKNHHHSWNAGKTKEDNESLLKLSKSLKLRYSDSGNKGAFSGRTHSDETRRKMRHSALEYIRQFIPPGFTICPRIGRNENDFFSYIQSKIPYIIKRNQNKDDYFPDGFIEEAKLSIEFNESFHETSEYHRNHDIQKINDLKKLGILTVSVKESEWFKNKDLITEDILFVINCRILEKELGV